MLKELFTYLVGLSQKPQVMPVDDYKTAFLTPDGIHCEWIDVEGKQPGRVRRRGLYDTADLGSFVAMLNARADEKGDSEDQPGIPVFVNPDQAKAICVFNLNAFIENGKTFPQGHGDDKAVLELKKTREFASLLNIHDTAASQKAVITWLEEYAHCIDGAADIIPKVRKMTLKSAGEKKRRIEAHSSERSDFETIEAEAGGEPPPTQLLFSCQPYPDLAFRLFTVRFNSGAQGDDMVFHLSIVQYERVMQEISQEFQSTLKNQDLSRFDVLIGHYRP